MLIGCAIKHLSFLISINFPMTTIAATHIMNVRHFSNMALDGCYSFFTQFRKFLCCDLRIFSNLIFYPFIKTLFLSAILSITLGIILSITLGITPCWSHKRYHDKATIDRPCRCSDTSFLASIHDTFHARAPVLDIGCTVQHVGYKRIVWI